MGSDVFAAFGSGYLFAVPLEGDKTPVRFGILQDVTLDLKYDMKPLFSRRQFAIKQARGKAKATWKAKSAQLDARALNSIFFGDTITANTQELTAIDEAQTVTSQTATISNAATFLEDLGVKYTDTGVQLIRNDVTPSKGEYAVSAGVYSFNADDEGASMLVSYSYSVSMGSKVTLSNKLMGSTVYFEMIFDTFFEGKHFRIRMLKSIMDSWNFATKLDDFTIPDASGEFIANDANVLGYMTAGDAPVSPYPPEPPYFLISVMPVMAPAIAPDGYIYDMPQPWSVHINRYNGHVAPISISFPVTGQGYDNWGVYINSPNSRAGQSVGLYINDAQYEGLDTPVMDNAPDDFIIDQAGNEGGGPVAWLYPDFPGVLTATDGTDTKHSNAFYIEPA